MPLTNGASTAALEQASAASAAPSPSPAYLQWKRHQRMRVWSIRMTQFLLLVAFLFLWEVSARSHWVNPMLTSYPTAVWTSFAQTVADGSLWQHVWITLIETVASFTISMVLGVLIAIVLWLSPFLDRVLDPFLVVGNALPKIALVPIFYIWLGPQWSIYGIAVAISVFITILMAYTGFCQTDPNKLKLARTFGASRLQTLQKVVLPSNLMTIIAALKANIGLALVGVIVGEFQSSKAGLGYMIQYGSQIFKMDMVMMAIVILGIISLALYSLIQFAENAIMKTRRGAV
ncbi:MAG TPA: ABC transporter permease [Xanthobacteraceae bacterium]|nr:ABC transporter permease [Xanthobacteraceae bacterium]